VADAGAGGSSKDAAIVSFSNQVFEQDPQAAYTWAESVGDPNQRQSEVYSLLSAGCEAIHQRHGHGAAIDAVRYAKAQLMQRAARN